MSSRVEVACPVSSIAEWQPLGTALLCVLRRVDESKSAVIATTAVAPVAGGSPEPRR